MYIALLYHGEAARNNRMVADIEDQVPPLTMLFRSPRHSTVSVGALSKMGLGVRRAEGVRTEIKVGVGAGAGTGGVEERWRVRWNNKEPEGNKNVLSCLDLDPVHVASECVIYDQ